MKDFKKTLVPVLLFTVLLIPALVFAKGGGGGGTVDVPPPEEPTCSEDVWSCTSFSACSLSGTQTRTCSLVEDCATANTPKPSESQSCTPSCTQDEYSCTPFSECVDGNQSRTCSLTVDCPLTNDPKPSESQSCTVVNDTPENNESEAEAEAEVSVEATAEVVPVETTTAEVSTCKEDTYECTEFSQCQKDGHATRVCELKTDCPDVETPKPEERQVCSGLQCGQLEGLSERIECRLKLSKQELATEFDTLYFPEYCKIGGTEQWQQNCISLYRSFGTCWQKIPGEERLSCAKDVLKMNSLQQEKVQCLAQSGSAREACQADIVKKVKNFVLFNLYELSFKTEMLLAKGAVNLNDVVAIETLVEQKKQELHETSTRAEWKQIVSDVKVGWAQFINKVK